MNTTRRKSPAELYDIISDVKERLEYIKYEEEECFENIPENLEGSERYEKAQAAIENFEEAISNLEEALEYIESASE